MEVALLRSRQIFKFGLLNKKNNKKNLKIRLVFNRMVVAFFQPYYSYTKPLSLQHSGVSIVMRDMRVKCQ
jgi:hypothetical protein